MIISTKVRVEALSEKLDHLRNRANTLIEDIDSLEKRVAELEFNHRARKSSWKMMLAIVGALSAVTAVVQVIISWIRQ